MTTSAEVQGTATTALLQAQDLTKRFVVRGRGRQKIRAVDGVSLRVEARQWLGLVGESGCGKSTLARLLVRLVEPDSGTLLSQGEDALQLRGGALRAWRRRIQIVFQDASGSLNPRLSIGSALSEVLAVHRLAPAAARPQRVAALLERVGLDAAQVTRYPHELSGGQRQRVVIARALAVEPALLVCDEPVSALDVSVQAQIVNLLADLRDERGLAGLFISHDLRVVRQICGEVAVMYLGRIVEQGPADRVYAAPLHPYTQALLQAVPEPVLGRRPSVPHAEATAARPESGCAFAPRCPHVLPICRSVDPLLEPAGPGHSVACHLHRQASSVE